MPTFLFTIRPPINHFCQSKTQYEYGNFNRSAHRLKTKIIRMTQFNSFYQKINHLSYNISIFYLENEYKVIYPFLSKFLHESNMILIWNNIIDLPLKSWILCLKLNARIKTQPNTKNKGKTITVRSKLEMQKTKKKKVIWLGFR